MCIINILIEDDHQAVLVPPPAVGALRTVGYEHICNGAAAHSECEVTLLFEYQRIQKLLVYLMIDNYFQKVTDE